MAYTVKQLAKLTGVSVRTLHYYDEIGLLKPSYVKANGYRCYKESELIKLQQILFFRELEFSLEQIIAIFDAPVFDAVEALADQRRLLEMKRARLDRLLATSRNVFAPVFSGCPSFVYRQASRTISRGDRTSLVRAHRIPRHHQREFLRGTARGHLPPYLGHRRLPLRRPCLGSRELHRPVLQR